MSRGESGRRSSEIMKRTIATGSEASSPQPPVLPNQQPQRHQARCHVVVPAAPGAHLVVIEPDLAIGVLERLLDELPARSSAHHLSQRCVQRAVGEEEPALVAPQCLDGEERLDSRLASTPCAISASQVMAVVVIAAYGAGLRISEACRLRPEDTTARGG